MNEPNTTIQLSKSNTMLGLEYLPIGVCCTLACQFEALAAKPGNVQRGIDFEDLSLSDLLVCGAVLGPILEKAAERRVGETILVGVRASRKAVVSNANLGIVLLLAPLAKVPRDCPLESGIRRVLAELTQADANDVFMAIREAQPGGLGNATEADVASLPTISLVDAMRLSAERDLIARQYATDYADVFGCVVPWLKEGVERGESLSRNIVRVYLQMMSNFPDSLIQRKCGVKAAQESADRAADVLKAQQRSEIEYEQALADFDFWLRVDGHRRNPGTTADMMAAGLFVVLREGAIASPFRFYEA